MIEGIHPFIPLATAGLLLSIALSAPSLILMIDARVAASPRLRLDVTIGISVLCASLSLVLAYENRAVALLGLACAITSILVFDRHDANTGRRRISSLLPWSSAALFLTYLVHTIGG